MSPQQLYEDLMRWQRDLAGSGDVRSTPPPAWPTGVLQLARGEGPIGEEQSIWYAGTTKTGWIWTDTAPIDKGIGVGGGVALWTNTGNLPLPNDGLLASCSMLGGITPASTDILAGFWTKAAPQWVYKGGDTILGLQMTVYMSAWQDAGGGPVAPVDSFLTLQICTGAGLSVGATRTLNLSTMSDFANVNAYTLGSVTDTWGHTAAGLKTRLTTTGGVCIQFATASTDDFYCNVDAVKFTITSQP